MLFGNSKLLKRNDLGWPHCIGKAFRIAVDRVNRNTRKRTIESKAKSSD
jgi:hypothetical protein